MENKLRRWATTMLENLATSTMQREVESLRRRSAPIKKSDRHLAVDEDWQHQKGLENESCSGLQQIFHKCRLNLRIIAFRDN